MNPTRIGATCLLAVTCLLAALPTVCSRPSFPRRRPERGARKMRGRRRGPRRRRGRSGASPWSGLSHGVMEDFTVDLLGVPPLLAGSAEAVLVTEGGSGAGAGTRARPGRPK